jgi:hypothetical protein
MKEYFPNGLKMQETLIKKALKEVTNKKWYIYQNQKKLYSMIIT